MAQLDYRTRAISSLSTDDTDSEDSCDSSAALPGRRKSMSFVAVRSALYQLTCFSDFKTEKLGSGFFAEVFKVKPRDLELRFVSAFSRAAVRAFDRSRTTARER